jgi:hypothetical protein
MEEKRKELRMEASKAATIAFDDNASVIECAIRNLSLTGACLEVADPVGLPERFNLVLDTNRHPCRVVWREADRVGVEFEGPSWITA